MGGVYHLHAPFILSFAGISIPFIHGESIGILFSLFVIGLGAYCLACDFDFIEQGVENGAPKSYEWRAVFGLLVTLVWIYLEMLRLPLAPISKVSAWSHDSVDP